MSDFEHNRALMESSRGNSSDEYFGARHEMIDTRQNRNIFDSAFSKGWNAAIASMQEAKEEVYALRAKIAYLLAQLKTSSFQPQPPTDNNHVAEGCEKFSNLEIDGESIASMHGEAVATVHQKYTAASEHGMFAYTVYSDKELSVGDKFYTHVPKTDPVAWLLRLKLGNTDKVERFVRFHPNDGGQPLFTYPPDAAAEIARLTKELEEARKDAERYRMMRSLDVTPYEKWNKSQKALHRAMNSADTVEMVDAAVDAAISKIGGGE